MKIAKFSMEFAQFQFRTGNCQSILIKFYRIFVVCLQTKINSATINYNNKISLCSEKITIDCKNMKKLSWNLKNVRNEKFENSFTAGDENLLLLQTDNMTNFLGTYGIMSHHKIDLSCVQNRLTL